MFPCIVLLGALSQWLGREVQVECLPERDALRPRLAALLVRVGTAAHANEGLPSGIAGLLGVERGMVAQLRANLLAVDQGLDVVGPLGRGDDEVEAPEFGVGVEHRLAALWRGCPLDEGLRYLGFHALAPSGAGHGANTV